MFWLRLFRPLVIGISVPIATFWSIHTLIPAWGVPVQLSTILAFWVLYALIAAGIYVIRVSYHWDLL